MLKILQFAIILDAIAEHLTAIREITLNIPPDIHWIELRKPFGYERCRDIWRHLTCQQLSWKEGGVTGNARKSRLQTLMLRASAGIPAYIHGGVIQNYSQRTYLIRRLEEGGPLVTCTEVERITRELKEDPTLELRSYRHKRESPGFNDLVELGLERVRNEDMGGIAMAIARRT